MTAEEITKNCPSTIIKGEKWYSPEDVAVIVNHYKSQALTEIIDIINSENSGLSHQQRLNEIEKFIKSKLKES